jgi:purine-binding chemotaxis protein CheW
MADQTETIEETLDTEKYLIFSVLGKKYTFQSRLIGEVTLLDTIYPLPLMPAWVMGVINRYSVPYALFDIGLLMFNTPSNTSASCKTLVLKDSIDRVAFLIDDVYGIIDVPVRNIFAIERGHESGELSELVQASFNIDGEDIFILDVNRVIERISRGAA